MGLNDNEIEKTTRVLRCTCNHDYQDKQYGHGMRLHNRTGDSSWRCTVCGAKK